MCIREPGELQSPMIAIRGPGGVDDVKLIALSRLNPGYQFERGSSGELIVSTIGSDSGDGKSNYSASPERGETVTASAPSLAVR
jgi:hypothetical protein